MHGICHIEIPSKDFDKAKKFYGEVFGWECNYVKEMDYLMFKAPAGLNGGFTKEHELSARPGVLLYIEVSDIPGTVKKIERSGGKVVVGKTMITPEIGYFAMVNDLEGNRLGLWAQN